MPPSGQFGNPALVAEQVCWWRWISRLKNRDEVQEFCQHQEICSISRAGYRVILISFVFCFGTLCHCWLRNKWNEKHCFISVLLASILIIFSDKCLWGGRGVIVAWFMATSFCKSYAHVRIAQIEEYFKFQKYEMLNFISERFYFVLDLEALIYFLDNWTGREMFWLVWIPMGWRGTHLSTYWVLNILLNCEILRKAPSLPSWILEDSRTGKWHFIVFRLKRWRLVCLAGAGNNVIIIHKWLKSSHREEFCDAGGRGKGRIRALSLNPHIESVTKSWWWPYFLPSRIFDSSVSLLALPWFRHSSYRERGRSW